MSSVEPQPVSIPLGSRITEVYDRPDLADAFAIDVPPGTTRDPEALARFVFSCRPRWVTLLMSARDALVSVVGLKTGRSLRASDGRGDRVGIFRLYEARQHEVILGEDDKHLDFRVSLELRIGVETEAAGLAARRRTPAILAALREALAAFASAVEAGRDAVVADFQFHAELARATQNEHFSSLIHAFGTTIIPRARLDPAAAAKGERQRYLRRVNAEHGSILDAVDSQDADAARAAMRTHLANSRERRRRAARAADARGEAVR